MLFKELGIKQGILKGLEDMKYLAPTDIQEKVIKLALTGKNIVGQSQTGTGKTAAFLIPLLQHIDTNQIGLQALILAPTRELVTQIGDEIMALTKYYRVKTSCVYGGASVFLQKKSLLKNPSIIIATPGRLMDFINQKVVNLKPVKYLILDEVDRMLDMGFVRDIKKLRNQMPQIQQTYTFSATISFEIKEIIKQHISSYEFIKIGEAVTVDKINHSFLTVAHEHKLFNLINIIKNHINDKILIFTQTKRNTKTIQQIIAKAGYKVGLLNGDMNQSKRQSTLQSFKESQIKILVTTDVAARGLNMDNVGLVINFDVPKESESYIHRIGRTGRAGANGKAIMLVSPEEHKLFTDIERVHKTKIPKSEHQTINDKNSDYINFRLDKSTISSRSNPNHKKHEKRPRRFKTTTNSNDTHRSKFRGIGKPKHR